MKLSTAVKPISYLKAHASELIREITNTRQTLVVTHNGEASEPRPLGSESGTMASAPFQG